MQNYFDIFELSTDFNLDKKQLKQSFNQKIIEFHPDKFSDEKQKNTAVKNTSLINTAFKTLNDEVSRGAYILELKNIFAFDEKNTKMRAEFLMEMVELQEELATLDDDFAIDSFIENISQKMQIAIKELRECFAKNDLENAKNLVRELKFYQRTKTKAENLL